MQDVGQRYPKWLEENKGKIPPEEHAQHTAQLAHINAICTLLEEHGDTKFDELLRLLQEVRALQCSALHARLFNIKFDSHSQKIKKFF